MVPSSSARAERCDRWPPAQRRIGLPTQVADRNPPATLRPRIRKTRKVQRAPLSSGGRWTNSLVSESRVRVGRRLNRGSLLSGMRRRINSTEGQSTRRRMPPHRGSPRASAAGCRGASNWCLIWSFAHFSESASLGEWREGGVEGGRPGRSRKSAIPAGNRRWLSGIVETETCQRLPDHRWRRPGDAARVGLQ
jgi:hypothetical protein